MGNTFQTTKPSTEIALFNSSYSVLDKLGAGGFGQVYLGLDNRTSNNIVIKTIKKKHVSNLDIIDSTLVPREVKIMSQLSHPNIIAIHDFFNLHKHFVLIIDYIPGSLDLFDYLTVHNKLSESKAKTIFKQIMLALDYLHTECQVAHLDIKPENILITPSTLQIKLIDFGAANYITSEEHLDFDGTRQYACPEILQHQHYKPVATDLWACGVTLYTMLMGHFPFFSTEDYYKELRITRAVPVLCEHVIRMLLCRQQGLRPVTVKEVLKFPWLRM